MKESTTVLPLNLDSETSLPPMRSLRVKSLTGRSSSAVSIPAVAPAAHATATAAAPHHRQRRDRIEKTSCLPGPCRPERRTREVVQAPAHSAWDGSCYLQTCES